MVAHADRAHRHAVSAISRAMAVHGGELQVVWFKRDLRVTDHVPLQQAARQGPVLCLYIHEPETWAAQDADASHLVFINACLEDLRAALADLGATLVTRRGEATDVLSRIHAERPIHHLWSHEETGNLSTYARDERVRRLVKTLGIPWTEVPQTGVVRRLATRDGWAANWEARMRAPRGQPPARIMHAGMPTEDLPTPRDVGLAESTKLDAQPGGASRGWEAFRSFLRGRVKGYARDISSPLDSANSCSRLSPYLAHGCLSVREVYQLTAQRRAEAFHAARGRGGDAFALDAFMSRLRWHCHFMQKLEDHPAMELAAVNPALDDIRPRQLDVARHDRFIHGMTGFPLVDASVRALHRSGWVNFRMRAMLVSFYCHDLWMDWRNVAPWLARQFVDLEAGIHYPQVQMQAGVTGINTLRIYNPTLQAQTLSGASAFIRRHVPELAQVPDRFLATPWLMPSDEQVRSGCIMGKDYPPPMVDHAEAARAAKERFTVLRRRAEVRVASAEVMERHGSRAGPMSRRRRRVASGGPVQLDLLAAGMGDGEADPGP